MYEPLSPRVADRLEAVLALLDPMLSRFSLRLEDRITPLPGSIRATAEVLLRSARRILSRDPAAGHVPALSGDRPIAPGELFVALLQASTALREYAARHDLDL